MLGARRENKSESTAEKSHHQPNASSKKKLDSNQVKELFKPADPETVSLLHSICSRFGHLRDDKTGKSTYILSVDFVEALDDLMRLMLMDEGAIIIKLGEMGIMEKHLLPMLHTLCPRRDRHEESILALLDLILLFTSPDIVADRAPQPLLLDYRRQYKRLFHDRSLLERILDLMVTTVAYRPDHFEADQEILSRIIKLIRNILIIPDYNPVNTGINVSIGCPFGRQERIIEALVESRLMELLMIMASSGRSQKQFSSHSSQLLEIFQLIFCHFNPDDLAQVMTGGSQEVTRDESLLNTDRNIARPIRHSRFAGSVQTGENYVISSSKIRDDMSMDKGKRIQHRPKKLSIEDFGAHASGARTSEKRLTGQLAKDFVLKQGLAGLTAVFHDRIRSTPSRDAIDNGEHDRNLWNYYRLLTWHLRFGRKLCSESKSQDQSGRTMAKQLIDSILDVDVMIASARMLPRLLNEKQLRLLLAVVYYFREAFRMLDFMLNSETDGASSELKKDAMDLQKVFFYRQEAMDVFRLLLQNSQRIDLKGLVALVEANHVLLKLLEQYCKEKGHIFTTKQRATTRISNDLDEATDDEDTTNQSEQELLFDVFLSFYATEAISNAYLRLLRDARNQDANTNRYVASMIARLCTTVKAGALFHKVSFLNAFHSIIYCQDIKWRPENGPIIRIASHVAGDFMKLLKDDPVMLIQAFFSHLSIQRRQDSVSNTGRSLSAPVKLVTLNEEWSREERLRWLINILMEEEMSQSISWFISILFDVAAQRQPVNAGMDDNSATQPIVHDAFTLIPERDSLKDAFNDSYFCTLLVQCSCQEPTEENPNWCIPGNVPAEDLLGTASTLQTLSRATMNLDDDRASGSDLSSDDEPVPVGRLKLKASSANKTTEKRRPAKIISSPKVKTVKQTYPQSQTPTQSQSKLSKDFIDTEDDEDYEDDGLAHSTHFASASDLDDRSIPSDQESTATKPDPTKAPASRWQQLKSRNFFLAAQSEDEDTDNEDSNNVSDSMPGHEPSPGSPIKTTTGPKRPPMIIYSDGDEV